MEDILYFKKQRDDEFYMEKELYPGGGEILVTPDTRGLSSFNDTGTTEFAFIGYKTQECDKVKDPYKNDWKDEDGDDEYIPDVMCKESYNIKLNLAMKILHFHKTITEDDAVLIGRSMRRFVNYLIYGGEFMVYISDNGFGRRNVRFESYDEDARVMHMPATTKYQGVVEYESVIKFSVTLKVNDPSYQVLLVKKEDKYDLI